MPRISRLFAAALLVCAVCLAAPLIAEEPERTGLFLILAEASSPEELPEPQEGQYVAEYDYEFRDVDERPEPKYFLLRTTADVPLHLAAPPERHVGEGGRTTLQLDLKEEAAAEMERVTRENIGRAAAFVVDGEVITAHKIRTVIEDGKLMISRCTDDACEFIYATLTTR